MSDFITEDQEKMFIKIISQGGSIAMNKHDLRKLNEAIKLGTRPHIFNGVKIYEDRLGALKEGTFIVLSNGNIRGTKFPFVLPTAI